MSASGSRDPHPRRWAALLAASVTAIAVGSVLWAATLPAGAPPRSVRLAPGDVILSASDIQDLGWGLRASGSNGTGVWRLFSGHNELVLAFLNVTLWIERDAAAAAEAFAAIETRVTYPTQAGGVPGADASVFWSAASGPYAGMLVHRYNVVFLLSAYLESSWSLTRSDLATWAGWQVAKIDAAAT